MEEKKELNEEVHIKWLLRVALLYMLEYTWIDLQEASIFSDNPGISFRSHIMSHGFPLEPEIREDDSSLYLSNVNCKLQAIYEGVFAKHCLRCGWS